jgi:hypothetical protein
MYDGPPEWTVTDKCHKREGYLILLGTKDNKVVGLTTQCSINFIHPGYQFVDPTKGRDPDYAAGVLALRPPGNDSGMRDYYMVHHEMNLDHPKVRDVSGRFRSEFLPATGMSAEFWNRLLESGDLVSFRPIGRNDLAFVTFEQKKVLGVSTRAQGDGLFVAHVMRDSPADKAGIEVGDLLVRINDRSIRSHDDLQSALRSSPFNVQVRFEVRKPDRWNLVPRMVTFHHPGNFLTSGEVNTLGLEDPEKIVSVLLQELDRIGGLLHRDLLVQCHVCDSMVQRARIKEPPSVVDLVTLLIPVASGLIGAEAAMKLWSAARAYEVFSSTYRMLTTLKSEVGDLVGFFEERLSVGPPLLLQANTVEVMAGDVFRAEDILGTEHLFHLAFVKARTEESTACLKQLINVAARDDCPLVAIPDGVDAKGRKHVHLFLMRPGKFTTIPTVSTFSYLAFEGYLNLVMVMKGQGVAYDHNVSDGRMTRFILRTFKALDRGGF